MSPFQRYIYHRTIVFLHSAVNASETQQAGRTFNSNKLQVIILSEDSGPFCKVGKYFKCLIQEGVDLRKVVWRVLPCLGGQISDLQSPGLRSRDSSDYVLSFVFVCVTPYAL